MKTIELIVFPDGSSRVETKGFAGDECLQASRYLEVALGHERKEQRTFDFYRQSTCQSQKVQQK